MKVEGFQNLKSFISIYCTFTQMIRKATCLVLTIIFVTYLNLKHEMFGKSRLCTFLVLTWKYKMLDFYEMIRWFRDGSKVSWFHPRSG